MNEKGRRLSGRSEEMKIRYASEADTDAMLFLLKELFRKEADFRFDEVRQRRGLEMMLAEQKNRCLMLAEINGRVVGMCSVQLLISTAEGNFSGLVEDLSVHPEYQAKGIGSALLKTVEKWAVSKGASRLQLLADRNNETALDFYQKQDWQRTQLICLRKK
jgi:ribosomal protein S18 acetylase RimI-like enzyme